MSTCSYCHERKGKRPCPALAGHICSSCCGEHRLARIACPSDCVYLDSSSTYQQKRAAERFAVERRAFYKTLFDLGGEAAAILFNLVEITAYRYFHGRRDATDGELLAGLQSLRRMLSPLHIPAGPPGALADHLKAEYDAFAAQQAQQRQQGRPGLEQQEATEVLDKTLAFVIQVSGGGLQSNRFLTGLIGYIKTYHPDLAEQLTKQAQEGGRIVLPGDVPSGFSTALSPQPRQHGPHCTHHH
ncbi:hypothetical protein [Candidatus Nitrospira bockiana]